MTADELLAELKAAGIPVESREPYEGIRLFVLGDEEDYEDELPEEE